MSKPKLVGITGGIGSGKSTVCKVFETLGVQHYNADDRAKFLMENSSEVVAKIKAIFGAPAYVDDRLNREFIAAQAFENPSLLKKLNEIVHPAVGHDFQNWVQENSHETLLLKEAALLVETGSYKELDALILVVADEHKRIERVLHRDAHRNEQDVLKIIKQQSTDQEKQAVADYVIDSNGDQSLIKQVTDLHAQLIVA